MSDTTQPSTSARMDFRLSLSGLRVSLPYTFSLQGASSVLFRHSICIVICLTIDRVGILVITAKTLGLTQTRIVLCDTLHFRTSGSHRKTYSLLRTFIVKSLVLDWLILVRLT